VTGPEHYRKAEAKLEAARQIAHPGSGHTDENAVLLVGIALQHAQVHATLAQAAATADAARLAESHPAWAEVRQ
jgi:hypothetical protein